MGNGRHNRSLPSGTLSISVASANAALGLEPPVEGKLTRLTRRGGSAANLGAPAKVERARISERTKAGLARVKAKGQRLGRPALDGGVQAKILALVASSPGMSSYALAKAAG